LWQQPKNFKERQFFFPWIGYAKKGKGWAWKLEAGLCKKSTFTPSGHV
jgi:hypothetical protein